MPKSTRRQPGDTPPTLKPYEFHGVEFSVKPGASQAIGDCPFCGKEGKWHCSIESGKWDCKVCGFQGNQYGFLRHLWTHSKDNTPDSDYELLRQERNLLSVGSLKAWGVVRSLITNEWLVPGFGADGPLNQLYRYARSPNDKLRLWATSGIHHQLHGPCSPRGNLLINPRAPNVYLCEGPWDGIALWEILGVSRASPISRLRTIQRGSLSNGVKGSTSSALEPCDNSQASLLASSTVLATPGANVFQPSWCSLFDDKVLHLCADSDHPHAVCGGCKKSYSLVGNKACPKCGSSDVQSRPEPASLAGLKRAVSTVARSEGKGPSRVYYIQWGETTQYNPLKPDGYDVRDFLGGR